MDLLDPKVKVKVRETGEGFDGMIIVDAFYSTFETRHEAVRKLRQVAVSLMLQLDQVEWDLLQESKVYDISPRIRRRQQEKSDQ